MTADIPSWMNPAKKGLGLGELGGEMTDINPPAADAAPLKPKKPASRKLPQKPNASALDQIEDAEFVDAKPALPDLQTAADDLIDGGILAAVLPKLRGVRSVTIRVFGRNREVGPALLQQLRLRGLDVKLSGITQIVPPPISKISVRYQGVDATITLAPDIGG